MELKSQTILQGGRYVIHGVLGRGGFGVTYLAEQVMAKRKVCIKEFFPKDYYTRGDDTRSLMLASQGFATSMNRYKEKFVKEAQTIAALDHHNIIPIYDVFEENNTAYYVMEYIDGESLSDVIKRRGALSESEAVDYICQAGSALEYLHDRRIMHLDVKPGNIMVRRKDNRVVLIDFGLSKHYDAQSGEATSTTPVGVSHGYAPLEQYKQGGVSTFSPETDIYSLGATLYCLLTGQRPPEAALLINDPLEFPQHVSATLRSAITAAMSPSSKQRPASVGKFVAMFNKADVTIVERPITPKKPLDNEPKPKSGRWWLWPLLMVVVIAIVCTVVMNVGDDSPDVDPDVNPNGVVQPKSELSLLSDNIMNFDHNNGQGTIDYSLTNSEDVPKVTCDKSWVTITSVSKSGTITFDVAANSSEKSRSATIKVDYKGQSLNVTITQSGKTYKVGDYYNENGIEGIVFEVWDGGRHGKIVSLNETRVAWDSRVKYDKDVEWIYGTMTYADSHSDGKANTDKLMSRSDSHYFLAAKWCRDKGASWYLPAMDELKAIYNNRDIINNSLTEVGATTLKDGGHEYWSSTEKDEFYARIVSMDDGLISNLSKYYYDYVRAVSAF